MTDTDRIFSALNIKTREIEWFFRAREGNQGPFESREYCLEMLTRYMESCALQLQSGGRRSAYGNFLDSSSPPNSLTVK